MHPDGQIILDYPNSGYDGYLIELSPDETRWVTEDEKWALRRVSYVIHQIVLGDDAHFTCLQGWSYIHGHNQ